ncbi:diaminopimelate epimerase [soil metagenome]
MTFSLTKHHGLGNDFLVFLTDDPEVAGDRAAWVERAVRWCHRSHGVGADGLLIGLYGTGDADLAMTLVNADGSLAEMSGNGIRCLAQAEARRQGSVEGTLTVATDGGPRSVTFGPDPDGDPLVSVASVDMGAAGPGPSADRSIDAGAGLKVAPLKSATFDLGNPHLVLLVEDPSSIDVAVAGARYEAAYSSGMNVHFVAPTSGEADAITMVVWERGAGVTEACGTGATAVARAAHDWGLVGERVTVHMPGGDVVVDVGEPMVLHGPSAFIAAVEVPA